jgi:hypothetical protein
MISLYTAPLPKALLLASSGVPQYNLSQVMRRPRIISGVGATIVLLACALLPLAPIPKTAAATPKPGLHIREIKISGDNFVALENTGNDITDLSSYWIGYASDSSGDPLVPSQQLPAIPLPSGQTLIALYSGSTDTCDASYIDKLNFSFAKTGGQFAVWRMDTSSAGVLSFFVADQARWANPSKTATLPSGVDLDIRQETAPMTIDNPVWYKDVNQTGDWQVGNYQNCSLSIYEPATDQWTSAVTWQQATVSPPSVLLASVFIGGTGKASATIPASDRGLLAMQLSELLPNTAKPQTDADNEFIELYNPNSKSFDLSNFMLQTASSTSSSVHSWHIPVGTKVGPGAFKAFYSSQTHLSLSNGGGEVWLVDPLGTTVTHSDPYGKADDGMAWVNAGGKWQWTAVPTPGATNKIATPVQAGSVKTATVGDKKVVSLASGGVVAGASTTSAAQGAPSTPIHPWVLAVVAVAALLYGAYEYRHDLAYRISKYRSNRKARR